MIDRRTLTALVAGTAIAGTLALPAAADWRDEVDVLRIATAASDNQAARRARYEPVAEFLSDNSASRSSWSSPASTPRPPRRCSTARSMPPISAPRATRSSTSCSPTRSAPSPPR